MAISIMISYGKATAAEVSNWREDERNSLLLLHRGFPRYRGSLVRSCAQDRLYGHRNIAATAMTTRSLL